MSRTYMLRMEYDGTDFSGWQIQPDRRTVQGELESALGTLLPAPVRLTGAGRTDAGVHAEGQVASFGTDAVLDPPRLRRSLNGLTGDDLVVTDVSEVSAHFNARASARRRAYRYLLLTAPSAIHRRRAWYPRRALDLGAMEAAARHLVGRHSFETFAAAQDTSPSKVCEVESVRWDTWSHGVGFHVEADRFLHHMVRNIVGTLTEVGRGRRAPDDLPALIAGRDRSAAGPTAPARGLTLMRVDYPEEALRP